MTTHTRTLALALSVLLLAAACSSSNSTPTDSAKTPTTNQADGAVSSADNVLTVTPPDGSGPITVTPADPIGELAAIGDTLHAYELGPDGSVFDQPVELRLKVSLQELANGVFVVAKSNDGTLESIETAVEGQGDTLELVGHISHFSRVVAIQGDRINIKLDVPAEARLGEAFPLGLSVSLADASTSFLGVGDTGYAVDGEILNRNANQNSGYCAQEGTGQAYFQGTVDVSTGVDAFNSGQFFGTYALNLESSVECVADSTKIPPEDTQCHDRQTGDGADGCVFTGWSSVNVGPDGQASISVGTLDGQTFPNDAKVTLQLVDNNDTTGPWILDCEEGSGCGGFYGTGFEAVNSDFQIGSVTVSDDSTVYTFGGLPLTTNNGVDLILDYSGGTTDSGTTIDAGPRFISNVFFYIEITPADGGNSLESTAKFSGVQLAENLPLAGG